MIERQVTETIAQAWSDEPEKVRLEMHMPSVQLAPAEARQLAQELNDAADEAEADVVWERELLENTNDLAAALDGLQTYNEGA